MMTEGIPETTSASPATRVYVGDGKPERDSFKTLLLGGLAAGVIGGAIVLFAERGGKEEEPASRLEQARLAIALASERAAREGQATRKDAKKRGKKLSRKAQKEQEEIQTDILNLLAAARDEVRSAVSDARKRSSDARDAMEQVRARAEDVADEAKARGKKARKQGRKRAKELQKDAESRASDSRKEAASFVGMLRDRASDVEHIAETYIESALLPKLRDLEKDAAKQIESGKKRATEVAGEARKRTERDVMPEIRGRGEEVRKRVERDIIPEARERVEHLKKHAQEDLIPEAREAAAEFRKRAEKDYLPQAKDQVEHLAEAATKAWEQGSAEASTKLAEASDVARVQLHDAGESVKRGGRETRSLLLWTALAGTLIYKVFLNEEQRKQAREVGMQLFGEAKEIYGDVQGQGQA